MAAFLSPLELINNKTAVLTTYRHLLRATRIAFDGDIKTLKAARLTARAQFDSHRKNESGGIEAAQALEHAQGVTQILRENLVQGKNLGGEKYKLNIHEHTQRLDNETATTLKGTRKSWREVKESSLL